MQLEKDVAAVEYGCALARAEPVHLQAGHVPYFRCISRKSWDTRHLRIIISTAGMPSAHSRAFILLSICSFSFAGIRIHLFQSGCASASCLASSFVMNLAVLDDREPLRCAFGRSLDLHRNGPIAPGYDSRLFGLR